MTDSSMLAQKMAVVTRRSLVQHHQESANGLSQIICDLKQNFEYFSLCTATMKISGKSIPSTTAILDPEVYDAFYNRVCNEYIWPIFHNHHPFRIPSSSDLKAYLKTNERLASLISQHDGCLNGIWVHDYHFLPLAKQLRANGVFKRLGYFQHAPVPVPEWVSQYDFLLNMLSDLVNFDYIGVQTERDRENLLNIIEQNLNQDSPPIAVHPVAPASSVIHEGNSPYHPQLIRNGSENHRFRYLTAGRSDPIKGHIDVLKAFASLLYSNQLQIQVELTILMVPSRQTSAPYRKIISEIVNQVDYLNNQYSYLSLPPVRLKIKELDRHDFIAELKQADCLVLLPRHDGMNLIAKEYVLLRSPNTPGVVIMSHGTGARYDMPGAILVDPVQLEQVTDALLKASTMSLYDRSSRWTKMFNSISGHNARIWAQKYLDAFTKITPQH